MFNGSILNIFSRESTAIKHKDDVCQTPKEYMMC